MNDNYYLKYTVTIEDLIAFNIYHAKNSPSMLKQWHLYQRKIPAIIFSLFLFQSLIQRNLQALITGTVVALSIYIFFSLFHYLSLQENNIKQTLIDRNRPGETGEHILELTDTEIIEKTSVHEMKTKTSSLDKVVKLSDYIFIYISSVEAHVIPKSSITEGNLEKFLEELNRLREDNSHIYDN